jgi:hypothetical protein
LLSEEPLQIVRLGEEEAGSESSEEMHFVNRARGATFQWLAVRGWYELRRSALQVDAVIAIWPQLGLAPPILKFLHELEIDNRH